MPTLRERVSDLFRGPRERTLAEMRQTVGDLRRIVEHRPYSLGSALEEYDSHYLTNMVRHIYDYALTPGEAWGSERDRLLAVKESRQLFRWSPLAKRLITIWTDFGFGQNIEVTVRTPEGKETAGDMEEAQAWWNEFWTASRNRPVLKARNLHVLSDRLLVDGELFVAYFVDKKTGLVTMRTVSTDEVAEVITDDDDKDVRLWYKRSWLDVKTNGTRELYYPDWEGEGEIDLPGGSKLAQEEDDAVDVAMMQVAHNTLDVRGMPLLATSGPWVDAYKRLAEDLSAVAAGNASFVRQVTHKGGSRATDMLKAQLGTTMSTSNSFLEQNPPPVAGSTFIGNEALKLSDVPLSRAAGESDVVANMMLGLAGLGCGLYSHWLGKGEAYRLATAVSMEEPVRRQFARYQAFWADVWRDMVHYVLDAGEKYGGKEFPQELRVVDVSTDAVVQQDLGQYAGVLTALSAFVPADVIQRLALQALNVKDIDEIMAKAQADAAKQGAQMPAMPQEVYAGIADVAQLAREMLDEKAPAEARVAAATRLAAMLPVTAGDDDRTRNVAEGGPGSGNWGHAGRPGEVGGSAPKEGEGAAMSIRTGATAAARQEAARQKEEGWEQSEFGVWPKEGAEPTHSGSDTNWEMERYGTALIQDRQREPGHTEENTVAAKLKDAVVSRLRHDAGLTYRETNEAVRGWSISSNDTDLACLQMQESAAKVFGVPLSDWQKERIADPETKQGEAETMPEGKRAALLRAQYKITQELFAKIGYKPDDTIQVFRGIGGKKGKMGQVWVRGNAMESWSLNRTVATRFTREEGFVLTAAVPVRNIVGSYASGFGCLHEQEVVVLGSQPHWARAGGVED